MRVLFLHRSVGAQIVAYYRSNLSTAQFELWNYNANYNDLRDGEDNSAPGVIQIANGDTEPESLAAFFEQSAGSADTSDFFRSFDVVAIKSCYSASKITSETHLQAQLDAYSSITTSLLSVSPDTRLLIVTSPPRRKWLTNQGETQRCARLGEELTNRAQTQSSLSVFDLHALLSEGGTLARKFCRSMPYDQHPNSLGTKVAANAFASALKAL